MSTVTTEQANALAHAALPATIDPYYIPVAPGGISTDRCPPDYRAHYFAYLNGRDQVNFGMALMQMPGAPGYRLVQRATLEATKQLAVELGLTEYHVDATNRITPNGVDILVCLPIEEYRRRQADQAARDARQADPITVRDAHMDRITALDMPKLIRPVAQPLAEFNERRAHEIDPRPFVGGSGASSLVDPSPATSPAEAASNAAAARRGAR